MNKKFVNILIIGAGPAGLSSAIASSLIIKKLKLNQQIAIVEENEKIGKTILRTGNGRCNFSNINLLNKNYSMYNNPNFCFQVLEALESITKKYKIFKQAKNNTCAAFQMFDTYGLACTIEKEGKMYPYTNKASTIVDVLKYALEDNNIQIFTSTKVINIKQNNDTYSIHVKNKQTLKEYNIYANKIIVCTGKSKNIQNIFTNYTVPQNPTLGSLKTKGLNLNPLDGIRCHVKISLQDNKNKVLHQETGELLFRKYGISGICVFNLSRFLNNQSKQYVSIDFFPDMHFDKLYLYLLWRYEQVKIFHKTKSTIKNSIELQKITIGILLPQITNFLQKHIFKQKAISNKTDIYNFAKLLKNFQLEVVGIEDKSKCQIVRGGINANNLSPNSLNLNDNKNIYFAGEIVDIDGPCGGYNLHWAWSSGILAGISAACNY